MALRHYANGPATTLVGTIGAGDTALTVASASQFPSQFPYTIILDKDQNIEEAVDVTNAVGNLLTVVRGADSMTAFGHNAGAVVVHGVTARDHREANTHVNTNSGVHGVSGSVVGTSDAQTLTNKTLTSAVLNTPTINTPTVSAGTITSSTLRGVSVTSTGTANVPITVAGTVGQTADLLRVNDTSANPLFRVSAVGRVGVNTTPGGSTAFFLRNVAGDLDDGTLRIQLLTSQTGDPLAIVDGAAAMLFRVNSAGQLQTSQIADLSGSLSVGPGTPTLGVGAGATTVNIGQGAGNINIGDTSATGIQIGRSAGGGGGTVFINQNGAGSVSLPRENKVLIGGQGFTIQETTPLAPSTARAVWINSASGMVFRWDSGLNQWVQGAS